MIQRLSGIHAIADRYDGFIVDLWGVVHDGVRPYDEAIACLERLAGKKVLLLSNAPRRSASAQNMLRRMGVADHLYTHILTSGEATWMALRDRSDPWFERLGTRVYHLGPQRDRNVLDGLHLTLVNAPAKADFMLNTGPDDDLEDPSELSTFIPQLDACRRANLPMICANPDLIVMRAGVKLLCAGALAQYYRAIEGDVFSLGKPDPAIYAASMALLDMPVSKVLAIGDSLHTDIAGAAGVGLDSAWVLGGIHAASLVDGNNSVETVLAEHGLQPTVVIPRLAW